MREYMFGLRIAVVLMLTVAGAGTAYADCARDRTGVVYCSGEAGGGAVRDNTGAVVCGKGQCRRDRTGIVRCSATAGGGAEIDGTGAVQCLNGCQQASDNMCVRGNQ